MGNRVIDVGTEYRNFSDSTNDPSRVGAAENPFLENDLSTTIGRSTTGTEYHNRNAMSNANRTLLAAMRDINEIADKMGLPKTIIDQAMGHFKKVHDQKRLKNKSRVAIASACIYLACRQESATRSLKEMSALSGVQTKDIARCYKNICKIEPLQDLSKGVDSEDFVLRFCSNLDLPIEVQRVASHIALVAKEKSITDGRNPTSVAAAAIYMATQVSDSKKSQKEICEVAGCAESTLKHSYRLMLGKASELIPSDPQFQSRIDQLPPS